MRRAPFAPVALVVPIVVLLSGCGDPPAFVTVHLEAAHPRPAEVREVWSSRFRDARDRELLAISRASARLEPPGLVLDATVRVPSCTPETIEATRAALVDLTTTRHSFAIHRPAPEAAEDLAARLRQALGLDVATPHEHPGLLIARAPLEIVRPHLAPLGAALALPAPSPPGESHLWVVTRDPAIDGSAVTGAGASAHAIEITLSEAGAAALEALTRSAHGEHLVFVVDGAFALAPRIGARASGTLRLDLPPADAARTPALARAIAASNLADPPTLIAVEAGCSR